MVRDRLVLRPGEPVESAWAHNVWFDPQVITISSIKDAARQLKAIQRNWSLYSVDNHRRAKLIQEQLPHVSAKPIPFGSPLPDSPLGSWTLWSHDTVIASPTCSSPVSDGEYYFVENKTDPPNRAYLKLWETFTRLNRFPRPGELCLDLGSSPGGWSWVAAECGAYVFSIDKAPLDGRIDRHPRIQHCIGSGFGLDPRHCGTIDWLFSDMACYPERLYNLVTRWLELGRCRNFVCTVKLQGEEYAKDLEPFMAIPGSRLMHLSHNKHELTWVLFDTI
ncbi:SAM-dependent methyltransferase [Salidesulfovibrio brasiliensis]